MKRQIKQISFLSTILILSCFSCKKTEVDKNNSSNEKWLPVSYYLSLQDKSLFNFYYSNKTIQFSDSLNNQLVFKADSIYDLTTHLESDQRSGEMLQIQYKCQNNYFPNYSFLLSLLAKPDNNVDLNILFATGTYSNNTNNDFVTSGFYFNPKRPYDLDSINPYGGAVKYNFSDSIVINNKTFHNVYYYEKQLTNTDIKQTIKCYYTNNKGVIAFKNNDGNFWVKD